MNAPLLAALAVLSLSAPAFAGAGAEVDGAAFDGSRARPAVEFVRPDASKDTRTSQQIAAEEQAKADARRTSPRVALSAPVPAESEPADAPAQDNGPLYGLAGLGVGALFGGGLALALSRLNA